MRAAFVATSLFLLLAVMPARRAAAQVLHEPRARQGYYLAAGAYGSGGLILDAGDTLGPWSGSGGSFRMGQLLTRRFGLGLRIDFASASGDARSLSLFNLAVEAQRELWRNLTLRGAVGLGVLSLTDDNNPDEPTRGQVGAGYTIGLAWDWFPRRRRLTGGIALTPVMEAKALIEDPLDTFVALLGVELTWWTGLPRNQIELPEAEAFRAD